MNGQETRRQALVLAACVVLSIFGLVLHNAREFGPSALADLSTGTIPYASIQLVLLALWALLSGIRPAVEIALATTAGLQLVGGGILSVLPLPFLPFEPEQSLGHYLSHIILALLQLPLLIYPLRLRSVRNKPTA
jgi:hypothetical protein